MISFVSVWHIRRNIRGMNPFSCRLICAFAIGLSMGTAFAGSPSANRKPANNAYLDGKGLTSQEMISGDQAFAETETFLVRSERVAFVLSAMDSLGLSEDVDFAWLNKVQKNSKLINFVCYSTDCYSWAKDSLRVISKAPSRPEEAIGLRWKDSAIEAKPKEAELPEEAKIKARQMLRYTRTRVSS